MDFIVLDKANVMIEVSDYFLELKPRITPRLFCGTRANERLTVYPMFWNQC